MICTQEQLDALYQVYQKWQSSTPHLIMPKVFTIVTKEEFDDIKPNNGYLGIWVGEPTQHNPSGSLYIGIETDGHAHT